MGEWPGSEQVRVLSELSDQVFAPGRKIDQGAPEDSLEEFCQWKDVERPKFCFQPSRTVAGTRLSLRKNSELGEGRTRPNIQMLYKRTQSAKMLLNGEGRRSMRVVVREKSSIEPPPRLVLRIKERIRSEMPTLAQQLATQSTYYLQRRDISSALSTPKLRLKEGSSRKSTGVVVFRPIPPKGTLPIHSRKSRVHGRSRPQSLHSTLSTPGRSRIYSP